jgi:hypothetical protein
MHHVFIVAYGLLPASTANITTLFSSVFDIVYNEESWPAATAASQINTLMYLLALIAQFH